MYQEVSKQRVDALDKLLRFIPFRFNVRPGLIFPLVLFPIPQISSFNANAALSTLDFEIGLCTPLFLPTARVRSWIQIGQIERTLQCFANRDLAKVTRTEEYLLECPPGWHTTLCVAVPNAWSLQTELTKGSVHWGQTDWPAGRVFASQVANPGV